MGMMTELERLMEELFPANADGKTLRFKMALEEHFKKSIKEQTKQRIPYSEAFQMTLSKLGGKDQIKKSIRKINRPYYLRPYSIITAVLMIVYPAIFFLIVQIFGLKDFPGYLLWPPILGIIMFITQIRAYQYDLQMNTNEELNRIDNTTVLAGAGFKFKEDKV